MDAERVLVDVLLSQSDKLPVPETCSVTVSVTVSFAVGVCVMLLVGILVKLREVHVTVAVG